MRQARSAHRVTAKKIQGALLMLRLLAALLALLAACAAPAWGGDTAQIDFGNYRALIIGNNDYEELPRLKTAVADAAAVAELLRSRYRFDEVTLLLNASRADILKQMNRLRAELTGKDNLLVYYAGHGHMDRAVGEGYWLPVDAAPEDDTQWIKNERLTDYLRTMSARHVIVIADSCYSGTLTREADAALPVGTERTAWLARMVGKRGRTAMSSGGLEPVTDGGRSGHSAFAEALLAALRDNNDVLDGQTLFQRLKRRVVLNAAQTPEYADLRDADHEGGDFLFVPRVVPPAAPSGPMPMTDIASQAALDLALWASVKDSADPAMLEAYLGRFPAGTFAGVARLRLADLRDGAPPMRGTVPPAPLPKPAVKPPPDPDPDLKPIEVPFVVLRDANVRAGPTTASASLDVLQAGTEVRVAGRTADWLAIKRPDGGLAYIHASLLQDKATWQTRRLRGRLNNSLALVDRDSS